MAAFAAAKNPQLCWKPSETYKYESLWSLLNKICLWNCISISGLFSVLGHPKNKKVGGLHNLAQPDSTTMDAIQALTGMNRELLNESVVSAYLGINDGALFTDYNLRFCPECIAHGFHTVIFQMGFVEKCPLHKELLLEACPRCKEEIPYKSRFGYSCFCGHRFWPSRSRRKNIKFSTQILSEGFKETIGWLKCKSKHDYLLEATIASGALGHVDNLATYWANMYVEKIIPTSFHATIDYIYTKHEHIQPYKKMNYEKTISADYRYISSTDNTELTRIYQDAEKHIREVFLKEHQDCINNARHGFVPNIFSLYSGNLKCAYTKTYLLWRLYWEAENHPNKLGFPISPDIIKHTISHYAYQYRIELHQDIEEMNVASWCDKFLFRQTLLATFWGALLRVKQGNLKIGSGWSFSDMFNDHLPVVIVIPYKSSDLTVIHSWLPKKIHCQVIKAPEKGHRERFSRQVDAGIWQRARARLNIS